MKKASPLAVIGLMLVILISIVGGLAAAYSTHLAPDPEPCPVSLECFIMLNGTLIGEDGND